MITKGAGRKAKGDKLKQKERTRVLEVRDLKKARAALAAASAELEALKGLGIGPSSTAVVDVRGKSTFLNVPKAAADEIKRLTADRERMESQWNQSVIAASAAGRVQGLWRAQELVGNSESISSALERIRVEIEKEQAT